MKKDLQVAIVQTFVPDHKEEGEEQVRRLVREAVEQGADMVGLPEDCVCDYADTRAGYDALAFLAGVAREHNVYLFGATSTLIDGKLHNRGFLFDRSGTLILHHDKIEVTPGEEEGGIVPGHTLEVADTEFGRVAILVCLDSFNKYAPWFFDALRRADTDIVLVPSYSINTEHNRQHEIDFWVISLRALSRWFKMYVAAPGTIGENATPFPSFGHALILSPSGKPLAEGSTDHEEILHSTLDAASLNTTRHNQTPWPPYEIPKIEVVVETQRQ